MNNAVAEPTAREEIEAVIKAKIQSGGAKTGLYFTGLSYVVVRRSNDFGEPIYFDWFEHPISFSDLLNN
jgi:hypothetical protein